MDRDPAALAMVARALPTAALLQADLEGAPWPLPGRQFDAIVVTNYLWRPAVPRDRRPAGPRRCLPHETFADGHQPIGRPSRPDFLLQRGELLRVCAGLRVVAFEDGSSGRRQPQRRCVQRIAAVNVLAAAVSKRAGPWG